MDSPPATAGNDVQFVIWTTTPWTLPANLAIAVHPQELYELVHTDQGKTYVVASKRVDDFLKVTGLAAARDENPVSGHQLIKYASARHPWIDRDVRILAADFVAMDTGTGLVHIAPGHGREDYVLGPANKLEVLSPVDDRGRLDEPGMPWHGVHVFKANDMIMDYLQSKGALLYRGEVEHSYPHCWRCHKPVIFRATEQWFLSVEKQDLRARLLKALEGVKFYPEFGRNRITGMVETRPDWCLSRQRLWGTEIPASEQRSRGAGEQSSTEAPTPPRSHADPDIFDVWFESGVSWAAVLMNSKEWPSLKYPADMYLEGSDQHRGWFQVSLIPSVALQDKAPFKSILTHGFVMDGEGRPMSKSLGNVIAPEEIIKQYGADVLRLWVAASDYGGDVRLSQDILKSQAEAYRKVRNTLRYLLNNLTDFDAAKDAVPYDKLFGMDRWALHRLQEEVRDALTAYDENKFYRVTARLVSFCISDLSGFYLDAIKDRLYCETPGALSRRAAQTVLHQIASNLMRLLAPILSYTADECWRFFRNAGGVSLEDMPRPDEALMNPKLLEDWKVVLSLRESVLGAIEKARAAGKVKAAREVKARIRVRSPEVSGSFHMHGSELPAILGVSQVQWAHDANVSFAEVDIEMADGHKCARCWIYKMDVGTAKAWPDLCGRCADAVEQWQKTIAEVK